MNMYRSSTRPIVNLLFAGLVLVAQHVRCDDVPPEDSTKAREKAGQLLKEMKKEYLERSKPYEELPETEGKTRYGLQQELMSKMVRERREDKPEARAELVAAVLLLDDNDFGYWVSCHLIGFLAKDEYREELVAFLAQRCPERLAIYTSVESLLIGIADKELKDGTIVFCDAFDQSKSDEARKSIVAALRRGFTALGVKGESDEEFVKQCRAWYTTHRERLEPDRDYYGQYDDPGFSDETTGVLRFRDDNKKNSKRSSAEVPRTID